MQFFGKKMRASSLVAVLAFAAAATLVSSQTGPGFDSNTGLCYCEITAAPPPPAGFAPASENAAPPPPLRQYEVCACPPPPPPTDTNSEISGGPCSVLTAVDCRVVPDTLDGGSIYPGKVLVGDPGCRFPLADGTHCCVYGLTQDETDCTPAPIRGAPGSNILVADDLTWSEPFVDPITGSSQNPTYFTYDPGNPDDQMADAAAAAALCTKPTTAGGQGLSAYVVNLDLGAFAIIECCRYGVTSDYVGSPAGSFDDFVNTPRLCAPAPASNAATVYAKCSSDLIKLDYPPSVPSPACAPSSPNCYLTLTGTAGSPTYSVYSVVDESTVRISYSIGTKLINSLLGATASKKLAFYSSPDSSFTTLTYLGDVEADGTGFIDVHVSEAEFIQIQAYEVKYGPSTGGNLVLPCGVNLIEFTLCPTCTCSRRRSLISSSAAAGDAQYALQGQGRFLSASCSKLSAREKISLAQSFAESVNGKLERPIVVTDAKCEAKSSYQGSKTKLVGESQHLVFEFAALYGKEDPGLGGSAYAGDLTLAGLTGTLEFDDESSTFAPSAMSTVAVAGSK